MGPTASAGELLVPDLFHADDVPNLWVDNFFEAEDGPDDCLLIRLRPEQGHKLTIYVDERYQFLLTAAYPGTRVLYAGVLHERRDDGWYIDGQKVSAATGKRVSFSEPPADAGIVSVKVENFADATGTVTLRDGERIVGKIAQFARVYADGQNQTKISGNRRWYYGDLLRVIYEGTMWGSVEGSLSAMPGS